MASPTLDAVGTIFAATGTGPVTGTRPTGMATGQLEVALVAARENAGAITCSTSGWVSVGSQIFYDFDGGVRLSWWYHPYTAGDAAPSFAIAAGGGGGTGPAANGIFGILGRVSGHDTSSPLDATMVTGTGTVAAMSSPSITTVATETLVLAGFFSSNDIAHATPTNSATLVSNQLSATGSQGALSIVRKALAASGATGAFGLTQATSSRYGNVTATMAIKAPGSAAADTTKFFLGAA